MRESHVLGEELLYETGKTSIKVTACVFDVQIALFMGT